MSNTAPVILVDQDPTNFPRGRNLTVSSGLKIEDEGPESPLNISLSGNAGGLNAIQSLGMIWSNTPVDQYHANTYATKTFSSSQTISYSDINNVISFSVTPSKTLQLLRVLSNGSESSRSPRSTVNFIAGSGINITVSDTGEQTNVNIHASSEVVTGAFAVLADNVTNQVIAESGAYVATSSSLVTFALPPTGSAAGSIFRIAGFGTGGWKITQSAGQSISFGTQNTTVGTSGYLASTDSKDAVEVVCVVANTTFTVVSPVGNPMVF